MKRSLLGGVAILSLVVSICAVGCAPAPSSSEGQKGDDPPAVEPVSWNADADCSVCHTTEADSQTDGGCPASAHADVACATCHQDESGLSAVHEGADSSKMPRKLKETEVPREVCESCHDPSALASVTAASTVLTDKEGTVVNPHDLPEVEDHDEIQCGTCHEMHDDAPLEETAAKACAKCHHAEVYACGTCHSH